MNTPADPKEVAFRRFSHLMDCRHFNRLCGNDPTSRSWERENGPEIERLAAQHPDFDARFSAMVLERAADERKRQGEIAYWGRRSREALSEYRRRKR